MKVRRAETDVLPLRHATSRRTGGVKNENGNRISYSNIRLWPYAGRFFSGRTGVRVVRAISCRAAVPVVPGGQAGTHAGPPTTLRNNGARFAKARKINLGEKVTKKLGETEEDLWNILGHFKNWAPVIILASQRKQTSQ